MKDFVTLKTNPNPGPVCHLHKCDVETRSLQCTNTDNRLYIEVGDMLCPAVKLLK